MSQQRPFQVPHSNFLAWSFLIVVVTAPLFLRPSHMADSAEGWARNLEREQMRVAPLLLVRAAAWLDPGDPAHALHRARLYDALGRTGEARLLREELRRRWGPIIQSISMIGGTSAAGPHERAPSS